jgi:hypothetical protein
MTQFFKNMYFKESGMAALLTIVIVGASTLAMVIGAAFLSASSLDIGASYNKTETALAVAEGCTREGLRRLKINPDYVVADLILPIGDKSCIINITANNEERTITAVGVFDYFYKHIKAVAKVVNGVDLELVEWGEE